MMRKKIYNQKWNKSKRTVLRRNSTSTEVFFWMRIKNKQIGGLKFRRQHGIGKYIADFYCPGIKLVIELDGAYHNSKSVKEKDLIRDKYFNL